MAQLKENQAKEMNAIHEQQKIDKKLEEENKNANNRLYDMLPVSYSFVCKSLVANLFCRDSWLMP